jgi:hypothetical protein
MESVHEGNEEDEATRPEVRDQNVTKLHGYKVTSLHKTAMPR